MACYHQVKACHENADDALIIPAREIPIVASQPQFESGSGIPAFYAAFKQYQQPVSRLYEEVEGVGRDGWCLANSHRWLQEMAVFGQHYSRNAHQNLVFALRFVEMAQYRRATHEPKNKTCNSISQEGQNDAMFLKNSFYPKNDKLSCCRENIS